MKEIKDLVSFEIQETIKTDNGVAEYRKGHKLITYNSKALDAISDKKVRDVIENHRKETQTKGSVKVVIY